MLQHIMARGMFPSLAVAAQAVQRSVTGSRGLLKPARPVFDPLAPNLPEPFAHLPRPTKAESTIKTATFVKSSVAMHHMPPEVGPEFAFIGHSNVGKSSLLNLVTGSSVLAKVSKRPGKTTCINHFLINQKYYLVDCPGYGHACVSKSERVAWHAMTKEYFLQRRTLAHVFLLVDSTQPPNRLDVDAALWLSENRVPYSLIFTKVDLSSHGSSTITTTTNNKNSIKALDSEDETGRGQDENVECSNMASIVPTFCNAVQALAARQEHDMAAWRRKAAANRGADEAIIENWEAAACSRFNMPLEKWAGGRLPFYIPTSAKAGLGRESLLKFIAQLRQGFTMPVSFKK